MHQQPLVWNVDGFYSKADPLTVKELKNSKRIAIDKDLRLAAEQQRIEHRQAVNTKKLADVQSARLESVNEQAELDESHRVYSENASSF